MKAMTRCLTLFCTTIAGLLPTIAAQTVETGYPHKSSLIQNQKPYNHEPCSLLEDLAMLEEFGEQNRLTEQLLNTKLDEQDEDPELQLALAESQVYAQSLISYEAERPQRIQALIEKVAKSTQDTINELKQQLVDIDTKVRNLELKVIEKSENKDSAWDSAVDSYVAALKEEKEQQDRILPLIEEKTKFLAVLSRKRDASREERINIPSLHAGITSSTDTVPVTATSSFPAIPSSALQSLSSPSKGSGANSADNKKS